MSLRWQLVVRNAADAVDAPKKVQTEMTALQVDETAALLNAATPSLYVPILVTVTTGLRRGELLALKWSDIDLKNAVLTVQRSVEQVGKQLSFKQPKSAKGRRQIALPQTTVEALRSHRARQARDRLLMGAAYEDTDLVFARGDGTLWRPEQFTDSYRRFAKKAGFGRVRFHDLRHSHASQLLVEGVHPKVVSERLGHSSVSITLDVYSHVLPGLHEDAAAKIDAALKSGLKQ